MGAWLGGVDEASRPDITKKFWSYVKERELQVTILDKNLTCAMCVSKHPMGTVTNGDKLALCAGPG